MRCSRPALGCTCLLLGWALPGVARGQQLEHAQPAAPSADGLSGDEWRPADDERLPPHHVRSFIEMGAGLALGTTGYWLLKDANAIDWDNPNAKGRFDGSAWVFDNNPLNVNFLGHPLWGSVSYSFARANHHTVLGSYGYAFLTSFIWEFALEFKEKVSFNDVMVTPTTGVPLGEFFYKLGMYLDTGEGSSVAVDLARWVLGTGVAIDRAWDGRAKPRVRSRDNLGFSRAIWHRFELEYGVHAVQAPGVATYARYYAGLSARLVTLPGYLTPRSFGRPFFAAEMADFSIGLEGSGYGSGLSLSADTTLVGYHEQRLTGHSGSLRGHALTLGSSLGYRYFRSSANRYRSVEQAAALPEPKVKYHEANRREQYAALDLPGLIADGYWLWGSGGVELTARVQPSFAGLMASAFYDFSAANPQQIGKHILHSQGYFYGWGPSAALDARLALGPLRGRFRLLYGAYHSQQGLDRHPEEVTNDEPAWGDVLFYSGSLGVAPGNGAVSMGFEGGVRRFRSRVGSFERTARSEQAGVTATWTF